jgi:ferredoxin
VGEGWSVAVDRDVCIGSGMCVMYAGGTFDQDAEAKSFVRSPATGGLDEVRAAAEACPTGAIRLTIDSDGPEGGAA